MSHSNNIKHTITASTFILALSLLPFSINAQAGAIHKCTSPSGAVSFTDEPCPSGSESKNIKPDPVPAPTAPPQPSEPRPSNQETNNPPQAAAPSADEDPECAAMEKHQTPDELIAKANAMLHDGTPNGSREVCCKNGHVVPCDQLHIKPHNW